MERCVCGMGLRKFWLWCDTNGVAHASGFQPSTGAIGAVSAATTRDALLARTGGAAPKHWVQDADDPSRVWYGRCTATAAGARDDARAPEPVSESVG